MNTELWLKLKEWSMTESVIGAAMATQHAQRLSDDDTMLIIISALIQVNHSLTQKAIDNLTPPVIEVHCHTPNECILQRFPRVVAQNQPTVNKE